MRIVIWIAIVLCTMQARAQPYRLVCSKASLPELYTEIEVYAEEWKDGVYKRLPAKNYHLESIEATIAGHAVTYNRTLLYKQDGALHIDLVLRNQKIPLAISLPMLTDIRYNLYTDSIKPVLNYYVNVEGVFSNGKVYPLDTSFVTIAASKGTMQGLEWILPAQRNFEKVTFTTTCRYGAMPEKTVTLYLKKYKDPRDEEGYEDASIHR